MSQLIDLLKLMSACLDIIDISMEGVIVDYDLEETDEFYYIKIDLPGVSSSEINLRIKDDHMGSIIFTHKWTKKYWISIDVTSKIDMDDISANYANGVLTITLHKVIATFRDIIITNTH